jgi:autotransporter-associated beta strand protein
VTPTWARPRELTFNGVLLTTQGHLVRRSVIIGASAKIIDNGGFADTISAGSQAGRLSPPDRSLSWRTGTFTGVTTIAGGTLQIGAGGHWRRTRGRSVAGNITNNGALVISRPDTATYSGS